MKKITTKEEVLKLTPEEFRNLNTEIYTHQELIQLLQWYNDDKELINQTKTNNHILLDGNKSFEEIMNERNDVNQKVKNISCEQKITTLEELKLLPLNQWGDIDIDRYTDREHQKLSFFMRTLLKEINNV